MSIAYVGNSIYRLRVSRGSGEDRDNFSTNFTYKSKNVGQDGKTDEGKWPRAVSNAESDFISKCNIGKVDKEGNVAFTDFVVIWKRDYAQRENAKKLAPKTITRYKELLKRILPAIGHLKLRKITPTVLNKFYGNLAEIGVKQPKIKDEKKRKEIFEKLLKEDPEKTRLSNTTIHRHHELISSILGKAVQWEYITDNPASKADPPQPDDIDKKYLDDKGIDLVMDALVNEPTKYQAAVLLDIFTGLRRSELMGLNWADIDWDRRTLNVDKASQYLPGQGIFEKETKTKNSIRKIKIPVFVMELLTSYKKMQDLEKKKKKLKGILKYENDRIFIQRNGKPMHPDTLTQWFPEFLKKNGLDHVNLHGLRHTNASLMMNMGFDIATAASRLGDNKATYLKVYAHMFDSADKAVADRMDEKYNPKKSDTTLDTTFEK